MSRTPDDSTTKAKSPPLRKAQGWGTRKPRTKNVMKFSAEAGDGLQFRCMASASTTVNGAAAASRAAIDHDAWRPRFNPWLVALTVTLATFMEVLDTSIANIALPHIAGSFGASTDESTWVLTSYLVSNGIVLPISAWLATRFGRKRFYMTCVAIFATSSFLCGLAPSLGLLVFFRVLQGVGGGGLQPSEQAILSDTFRAVKARHGVCDVRHGGGGGAGDWPGVGRVDHRQLQLAVDFLHQRAHQHLVAVSDAQRVVEDPPYLREEQEKRKGLSIDYIGLGLVTLGIGCLQMVMDKGQELDWFGSRWITLGIIAAAALLITWIWWEWRHPHPIVELQMLRRRNVATAMFLMSILGMVLYGTTVLLPEFTQNLLGYPAVLAGEALAGGGFMMMLMMPISGVLSGKMDPRILMATGFCRDCGGALLHVHAPDAGHGFPHGFYAARLSGGGAGVYFYSQQRAVLCGCAARKEQSDFEHDQFRAQHRRKHRNRGDQHAGGAGDAEAAELHVGELAARESAIPADVGRHDGDVAQPGRERGGGDSAGVREDGIHGAAAGGGVGVHRRRVRAGARGG